MRFQINIYFLNTKHVGQAVTLLTLYSGVSYLVQILARLMIVLTHVFYGNHEPLQANARIIY